VVFRKRRGKKEKKKLWDLKRTRFFEERGKDKKRGRECPGALFSDPEKRPSIILERGKRKRGRVQVHDLEPERGRKN